MRTRWRYRLVSAGGTAAITAGCVSVANHPTLQQLTAVVPVFERLPAVTLSNGELSLAVLTTLAVVLGALAPLFKPRPRRRLDTVFLSVRRVALAVVALAAVGYFDYTYRLPRATLVIAGVAMAVALPLWYVTIRRRPRVDPDRAVVVGDDLPTIAEVIETTDVSVTGYVAPGRPTSRRERDRRIAATDGGGVGMPRIDGVECLGGFSRFEELLVRHDADAAILAFAYPDRSDFFGALDACYNVGVPAKVHGRHADAVLTTGVQRGELVDIDLEPWDWQDYVLKRAFDFWFALVGLVVLSPLVLVVAAAIKLDDGGPVFYEQTRTAEFGDVFTLRKFRTMTPADESPTPVGDGENDRITRVGRVLRPTHLDELPQLIAILRGRMSVVGPRAAWVDEEEQIERNAELWRKRWFVKPGLTGLAQINGVSSTDPERKLTYDVAYIRNQSFWFDLRIVVRQLWMVAVDAASFVRS
ncbi:sugar transferase [Salinirarus marinus]|uniref:sugar transferase n=1 Tax=Salinirarus marinus TaxID=3068310 RepID=UPI003C6C3559